MDRRGKVKNLSLRNKLFVVLSFFILVYTFCSILFVNIYYRDLLKEHFISMEKTLIATMSSQIVNDILTNDFVEIYSYFEDIMKNNPHVSYIFIEKKGQVLIHTFKGGFPQGLLEIGHENNLSDYLVVKTGNGTYYDFAAPIYGGRAGTLRLGISPGVIDNMLSSTIKSMISIGLALVITALLFSTFISGRLSRPLSILTAQAKEIAGGNYAKAVDIRSTGEIGDLASAFNKMEEAVRIRETELREINNELEAVNVVLHDYIEELERTKNELIKTKQDLAVKETKSSMLHHLRQPLTYLTLAIDSAIHEMHKGSDFSMAELQNKLEIVDDAGRRLAYLLRKFEDLNKYRVIEFPDNIRIIDVEE